MARLVTPLTDAKCEAAKARESDYTLFDGQGLHLLVKTNGKKVWRFKYSRPDGRAGLATFGSYPALSLKAARNRRAEARELLAHGIDPIENARQSKLDADRARRNTFEAVARDWHSVSARKWKPDHADTVLRRLETHLFPRLGSSPVGELKTRDLLEPLRELERRGIAETASRLHQYMNSIMRLAVQQGHIESNPAIDLQGAITTGKSTHRPALPFERIPELLERLDGYKGRLLTRIAVHFCLLSFVRSSELRLARWSEFDLDRALWTIPGSRTPIAGVRYSTRGAKMGTPHIVPLSRQAVELMARASELTGSFELVFPGDHSFWRPMSENTVNAALRRMGYDTKAELCGHGFRAMACSALTESGLWSKESVERQMAHEERNRVRGAYIHLAKHLQERRLMVQWWADYLDSCRSGYISPYDFSHPEQDSENVSRIGQAFPAT
ncbi:tyrosine-type recombinase/integrase [Stutzerimonas kunmingensis]|jgi:integrase|uniref:tyrosine-type recombinase/integrase n=1 Tax=Stutzerimonas kunmingensis TaxID=1211807 RepID=UPI0035CFB6C7